MGTEAFFNRPGTNVEISERIITDIKHAKKRILLSMAYITNHSFASALIESSAQKRVIFNMQDMIYPNSEDVKKLYEVLRNAFGDGRVSVVGGKVENPPKDRLLYYCMHHKFIVIDDSILWVGSYNASYHANNCNWENMLRITQDPVIKEYEQEFNRLFIFGKIKDKEKDFLWLHEGPECLHCENKIDELTKHYRYMVKIIKTTKYISGDLSVERPIRKKGSKLRVEFDRVGKQFCMVKLEEEGRGDSNPLLYKCEQCSELYLLHEMIRTQMVHKLISTDGIEEKVIEIKAAEELQSYCLKCHFNNTNYPEITIP